MWSGVKGLFDFNRGAIDILVVEQEDGSLASTPWHVRFGKGQFLTNEEQIVHILVNDQPVKLKLKIGEAGEAYFPKEQVGFDHYNTITWPLNVN